METEESKKENLEKENLALKNENLKMINRLLKVATFPVEIAKRIDAEIIKNFDNHQDAHQNVSRDSKVSSKKMDPAKIWAIITLVCLVLMCIIVGGSNGMNSSILLLPGIPAFILVIYLIRDTKKK